MLIKNKFPFWKHFYNSVGEAEGGTERYNIKHGWKGCGFLNLCWAGGSCSPALYHYAAAGKYNRGSIVAVWVGKGGRKCGRERVKGEGGGRKLLLYFHAAASKSTIMNA